MTPAQRTTLIYIGVAVISLAAGLLAASLVPTKEDKPAITAETVGVPEIRPIFSMPDLQGNPQSITQWDNKVVLLNFWATWCPPCRKEMPAFVELKEQYADRPFEIVGVSIDAVDATQDFIDQIGVEYPILHGEVNGISIMKQYGNQLTTLPYTVIIDSNGKIAKTFRTEVTKADIEKVIRPLLGEKS